MIINAITYKIQSIENFDAMRMEVMRQLGHLIPYDSSSFYLSCPGRPEQLMRPLGINYPLEDMESYIQKFCHIDYSEGLMMTGKNIAYRESDIIEEAVRVNSEYYRAVYVPHGIILFILICAIKRSFWESCLFSVKRERKISLMIMCRFWI